MQTEGTFWALLPPVVAIALALGSRQVILSLISGIWLGFTLLNDFNPLRGATAGIEGLVAVAGDAGDARVLMFTLLVGALIAIIEDAGGVRGFVRFVETRRWVHTARRARVLAWLIGLVIFIESNMTLMVAGTVSRPLFDRFRVSREKLAYLIDATSAPVCMMIPFNAWGAYVIGQLEGSGVKAPLTVFVGAVVLNLYALATIALALVVAVFDVNVGPMKAAEARLSRPATTGPTEDAGPELATPSARGTAASMLVPVATMVIVMPVGLLITGHGRIEMGVGSKSVLWAISAALFVAWFMQILGRRMNIHQLTASSIRGAQNLLPVAMILALSLALGDVAQLLQTGEYVAQIVQPAVPGFMVPVLLFVVSAAIAFSIGSSWGTLALMVPIGTGLSDGSSVDSSLLVGAILSGAIFGDHASPISDTTVVASLAAASDHIEHVRTQLPYALVAATIAGAGFIALGVVLG